MSDRAEDAGTGLIEAVRDERWEAEVARENAMCVISVERRAVYSNILLWVMMVLGAVALPNGEILAIPLFVRVVAMVCTRATFSRVKNALTDGADWVPEMNKAAFAMILGGASWALVLVAIMLDPVIHPARLVIGGGAMVGVSLVTSATAPVWRLLAGFLGGFVATFAIGMGFAPGAMGWPAIVAMNGLVLAFAAFAYAVSAQRILTSEAIVDNRRLGEELAESLAHAEFLAYRDPLTGLLNRRALFEYAADHPHHKLRHVLTIDLDHFKKINDRYGHGTGDKVLIGVSNAMRDLMENFPGHDHCAVRMGGEEFAVVLHLPDKAVASVAAEQLRLAIQLVADDIGVPDLVTTASIGFSPWHPGQSLDDALSKADGALYTAKARGRNRVIRDAA